MSTTVARVIRNTGYLYVRMGITMFISLYTTRIILQALGASDFGVFNIVGGTIAMLGFLNISMQVPHNALCPTPKVPETMRRKR